MRKKITQWLMILCLLLLGCVYSNNLMAEETSTSELGTSVSAMDFSELIWKATYDDDRVETVKPSVEYYPPSVETPWEGSIWSSSVEFKAFADLVSYCKVNLSNVKTDYIKTFDSQLDTNGIRVYYKFKNQEYDDSITPDYEKWEAYGFSIHCVWEDGTDSGLELSKTGKSTVNIMLGTNVLKSYNINVINSVDHSLSGTFQQPGTTYDVVRAKGAPGYYYKLVIPEDGDYDGSLYVAEDGWLARVNYLFLMMSDEIMLSEVASIGVEK